MASSHASGSSKDLVGHKGISLCSCSVVKVLLLLLLLVLSVFVSKGDGSSENSETGNFSDLHPSAGRSVVEQLNGQLALDFRGKHELVTIFNGTAGLAGIMFGVLNTSPSQYASITGLILHTSAGDEVLVKIYIKSGSHMDFDMDPHAWTMVAETVVEGQGQGQMTPIPDGAIRNGSLLLPPGETMALYVTLTAESRIEGGTPPALLCTNGTWLGAIAAQSYFDRSDGSSVILFEGAAVSYPLGGGNVHAPCIFNGAIQYDVVDLVEDANVSGMEASQSSQSTTTQPASSGEEENSKEVTAHLVLKLQTLTSTMDNDALLVLQAACQSFLGEMFRYTLPPVRKMQCQVKGQAAIDGRRRRKEQNGSSKMTKEHETGGIMRTVGEEGDDVKPALQVKLYVAGNVDMAVPTTSEEIDFQKNANDFFIILSGRFIIILREVSEGAGVSYFDTVFAVTVLQQSLPLSHTPSSKEGGNETEKELTIKSKHDGDRSSGVGDARSGGWLPLGLMIFLAMVVINVLGMLTAVFLIQRRRARNNTARRCADNIQSTPRGCLDDVSITSPPLQHQSPPSEPHMSPRDFEDGDSVNNNNDNNSSGGSDSFKEEDKATNVISPPLAEVPCSNTDDGTFTSRLNDFESVSGGAVKERARERAAAAALEQNTQGRINSAGGGGAIVVDEYISDEVNGYKSSSILPGGDAGQEGKKNERNIDILSQVSTLTGQEGSTLVSTFTGQDEEAGTVASAEPSLADEELADGMESPPHPQEGPTL